METNDLLCSRNARPQEALVGRAQWKINQPPPLRDKVFEDLEAVLEGRGQVATDGCGEYRRDYCECSAGLAVKSGDCVD